MEARGPYLDLSGVRIASHSPDRSEDGTVNAPAALESQEMYEEELHEQQPSQRSATGSPRHSTSNGNYSGYYERPSYVKARRASASTPGDVPSPTLRRRDSLRHPYSLTQTQSGDGELLHSTADSMASSHHDSHAKPAAAAGDGDTLFRAAPRGRRHSASVAVLHRDAAAAADADGAAGGPVNTTVSASPDRSALVAIPSATTQEDVKRYVFTVMDNHNITLGTWGQRVAVAEVYRDKPLRTGGHHAPLRAQDRSFLERIVSGVEAHERQLLDARALLQQTRHSPPPTKHGRRGDLDAWGEYCSCYEQTLIDLTTEAQHMAARVRMLLRSEQTNGVRTHRTRSGSAAPSAASSARGSRARSQGTVGSRRDSPLATPRGHRSQPPPLDQEMGGGAAAAAERNAASTPARRPTRSSSASPAVSGSTHDHRSHATAAAAVQRAPYVPLLNTRAVQRGSQTIRPGYGSESAMRPSPAPEGRGSWARANSTLNPLRASVASGVSLLSARSSQQVRALHPDTVVRDTVPSASPSDMASPYGRLMTPKRASSPLRDPSHAVLVVPPPADVVAAMSAEQQQAKEEEAWEREAEVPVTARSHLSRASRASRPTRGRASACLVSDRPPQLRTYSSPRATASNAAATANTPTVHPLRRQQLLEVIAYYEENAAALQRGDLHRARECFVELYGDQQGLRQYCQWIDDIAVSAVRTY